MPKSCSLRASMPIRTLYDTCRDRESLEGPPRKVEPIAAPRVAARAGVDVGLPRPLVERADLVAHRVGALAHLVECRAAAGRDRALHRTRVVQREPAAIERAGDAPLIARREKPLPVVVERVGVLRDR